MALPDQSVIIAKLKSIGYEDKKAEEVSAKLKDIDDSLLDSLTEWVNTDKLAELTVAGYSLESLVSGGMKPPAAFLTLDWLVREPSKAAAAIESGHDYIEPREIQ